MPDYVIRWDLKIEADTPDAAATEVVRVLRALYSTMTVSAVAVTDEAGRPVSIDLTPEDFKLC